MLPDSKAQFGFNRFSVTAVCPSEATDFRIELVDGVDGFERLRPEWAELWRSCPESTESQSWHWQSLYQKHIARRLKPIVVIARSSEGTLIALGSFAVRRNRATLLNQLEFFGE